MALEDIPPDGSLETEKTSVRMNLVRFTSEACYCYRGTGNMADLHICALCPLQLAHEYKLHSSGM